VPTSVPEAQTRRRDVNRLSMAWPVLGAFSLVLACVVLGRWLAGGVTSVDPGDDPMPTWQLALMHAMEWIQFGAFVAIVWWVVVRPLLQGRGLGFDGLFVVAAFSLNFWDVMDNYWLFSFQYNAHHLNVGSWGAYIPGWHSPKPELWAVPIGFVFGAYTWAVSYTHLDVYKRQGQASAHP